MSKSDFRKNFFSQDVNIYPGDKPGTLRPIEGSSPSSATIMKIKKGEKPNIVKIDDVRALPGPEKLDKDPVWVRIIGKGNVEDLAHIGNLYKINMLSLEDVLNPGWSTHLERNDEYFFFLLQVPPDFEETYTGEQVCVFYRKNLVISFEEKPTDLLDHIWYRFEENAVDDHIESMAGYLTYRILDASVDNFFPILNKQNAALSELELGIKDGVPDKVELHKLYCIKRDLLSLHRLISPYRELSQSFSKHPQMAEKKDLTPYFNDLCSHTKVAEELCSSYQEITKSLDDIFQSALSNKMNDIIKILTMISTVFMPLSFLAGLYGMNFDTNHPMNMPELSNPYGYPLLLLLMVGVVFIMRWIFKKKRWI